ncbi:MAG: hypothetical protein ACRDPW_08735, partial [Mycobacteriales bacterium]
GYSGAAARQAGSRGHRGAGGTSTTCAGSSVAVGSEHHPDSDAVGLNETALLLSWLEQPETRLVRVDGAWSSPVRGARRWEQLLDKLSTTTLPV